MNRYRSAHELHNATNVRRLIEASLLMILRISKSRAADIAALVQNYGKEDLVLAQIVVRDDLDTLATLPRALA
jgi:hypothetical protein